MPGVVYAVKRYVMYGNADAGQCNACAALGHHHPMPRYSTGVVALPNSLFKYVHFIFPLLSSKCLLSLLMFNNKLTVPEGKLFTNLRTFSLCQASVQQLQASNQAPSLHSSPAIAPPAHSSPPLLFNPPLLSHCKTGLRSPMTRAAHLILCSNSFHHPN